MAYQRHAAVVGRDVTTGAEDALLLKQARADPTAFAPIYERYMPRVYRYCVRRLPHPEEAEDATALVFARALGGVHGYRGGSVAAWLFQIAHHTVANALRDRRPTLPLDDPLVATPDGGPLDTVIRAEERQQLEAALATLAPEQRELLALKVSGELTAGEIAVVLGKSEGAVRVALHRTILRLRAAVRASEENTNA
jgi:RNA polymerase sigma-70 factor (ECF subfamily)